MAKAQDDTLNNGTKFDKFRAEPGRQVAKGVKNFVTYLPRDVVGLAVNTTFQAADIAFQTGGAFGIVGDVAGDQATNAFGSWKDKRTARKEEKHFKRQDSQPNDQNTQTFWEREEERRQINKPQQYTSDTYGKYRSSFSSKSESSSEQESESYSNRFDRQSTQTKSIDQYDYGQMCRQNAKLDDFSNKNTYTYKESTKTDLNSHLEYSSASLWDSNPVPINTYSQSAKTDPNSRWEEYNSAYLPSQPQEPNLYAIAIDAYSHSPTQIDYGTQPTPACITYPNAVYSTSGFTDPNAAYSTSSYYKDPNAAYSTSSYTDLNAAYSTSYSTPSYTDLNAAYKTSGYDMTKKNQSSWAQDETPQYYGYAEKMPSSSQYR
jgi:hypothetical protein